MIDTSITPKGIYRAVLDEYGQLQINTKRSSSQLCYKIRLMSRMELKVGEGTQLSLLLNSGCLHVVQLFLTGSQVHQLFKPVVADQQQQQCVPPPAKKPRRHTPPPPPQ